MTKFTSALGETRSGMSADWCQESSWALTKLINQYISSGIVPETWKEAVVSPVLKKGSSIDKNNFRPVSCLVTASKVLEKVVCNQTTEFLEKNNLLPKSQHGFRANHSTMTAHSNMQKDWINNSENGLKTGLLIWDLSAAFDTLDIQLLFDKDYKIWYTTKLYPPAQP